MSLNQLRDESTMIVELNSHIARFSRRTRNLYNDSQFSVLLPRTSTSQPFERAARLAVENDTISNSQRPTPISQ